MDCMAGSGYLWLPAQSPGHSKAPPSTWLVTSDPGLVANTGVGEVGLVGIRLPGPRPQMKESVVLFFLIPHAHLWGPGSCRTGISPNPGYSRGCVDKLYLQLYMCMCCTGGSSLALSPGSAADWLQNLSAPLCLSGAPVFSPGKQDSWIPAGAWAGVGVGGHAQQVVPDHFILLPTTIPASTKTIPLLSHETLKKSFLLLLRINELGSL